MRILVTWRLLCSRFLVMTYFRFGDFNILTQQEIHGSLRESTRHGALSSFGLGLFKARRPPRYDRVFVQGPKGRHDGKTIDGSPESSVQAYEDLVLWVLPGVRKLGRRAYAEEVYASRCSHAGVDALA